MRWSCRIRGASWGTPIPARPRLIIHVVVTSWKPVRGRGAAEGLRPLPEVPNPRTTFFPWRCANVCELHDTYAEGQVLASTKETAQTLEKKNEFEKSTNSLRWWINSTIFRKLAYFQGFAGLIGESFGRLQALGLPAQIHAPQISVPGKLWGQGMLEP